MHKVLIFQEAVGGATGKIHDRPLGTELVDHRFIVINAGIAEAVTGAKITIQEKHPSIVGGGGKGVVYGYEFIAYCRMGFFQ